MLQMDCEGIEEQFQYQQRQYMNRKEQSSSQNEEQSDQRQDDEDYLSGEDKGRKVELVLKKIALLEDNCRFLKKKNEQLFEDVTDLQYELQNYDLFTEDDSDENELITAIEKELQSFKTALDELRRKHASVTEKKNEEIQKLREELDQKAIQISIIEQENDRLADMNEAITKSNKNLMAQNKRLENELLNSRTQLQSSRTHQFHSHRDSQFDSEVQASLEVLIQKLVSELTAERTQKKKLNEEIRRMQREMLQLEKEITNKNNKLCEIEINYLKSPSKNHPTSIKVQSKALRQNRPNEDFSSDNRKTSLKTFSLMQFLQKANQTSLERFVIADKLVQFYLKKAASKDYKGYTPDNLLICNYKQSNLNLLSIRKAPNSYLTNQQNIFQNLGEMLLLLLEEELSEGLQNEQREEYLLNLICEMANSQSVQVSDVEQTKQVIEDCLKSKN